MTNKILVYIDHYAGQVVPASWEAVGVGTTLAEKLEGEVVAVLLGHDVEEFAQNAIEHGSSALLLGDSPELKDYRAEPFAGVLSQLAADAEVLLFPTSSRTRELAGMIAVDLETGVMPDVIAFEIEDGSVLATRPIYAGKLLTKVVCREKRPQILTLRSRAFPKPEPDPGRSGETTRIELDLGEIETEVTGYSESKAGVSLSDAAVIVSGGRGVSNNPQLSPPAEITDESEQEIWRAQQGFALVNELAQVLNAAMGASRAAVDAGYIPYEHQVGQTGKTVTPELYVACGISGAMQHLAGMSRSKVIVAVNKDAEAPIFAVADYGIVGDVKEVLPAMAEEVKQAAGE